MSFGQWWVMIDELIDLAVEVVLLFGMWKVEMNVCSRLEDKPVCSEGRI